MENNRIILENTHFIFDTNFAGDPNRDRFKSNQRKANIIIPDHNLAMQMIEDGFNVKQTVPREGEEEGFVPTFFVSVIINYESKFPPRIFLVVGDNEPVLLDPEGVSVLDTIRASNVDVFLNPRVWDRGKTLYVNTMYVTQDLAADPFAMKYMHH